MATLLLSKCYRNDLKFLYRHVSPLANGTDPDHTLPFCLHLLDSLSWSKLFCSKFRIIKAMFSVSEFLVVLRWHTKQNSSDKSLILIILNSKRRKYNTVKLTEIS